jgi:hypothetical protein
MKPCTYRGLLNAGKYACSNTHDLIHDGFVSERTCNSCPYASPPVSGFFAQTNQLLIQKARRGEIHVAAKPCGGCSETKHRVPDTKPIQFVWPYWEGGANGDELRWSIRSVETFFQGTAKITIIGDKPGWYHGHVIRKKRVPKNRPNRPFRDMLSKVFFIASHQEIDSECVWMMDDIYFLRPFTLEDIQTPRAEPWRHSVGNSWQRRKTASMEALAACGLSQHDYATHMPHWLEKSKLRTMFDDFNLHEHTMLWEVLYGNLYRETPLRTRPFFVRFKNRASAETLRHLTRNATVMNHVASAWCDGMRDFLSDLLPTPSTVEGHGAISKPTFIVKKKVARVVKRRPLETHLAYLKNAANYPPVDKRNLPHIMIVQSAYPDEALSSSRLEIARHTIIPALAFQTAKPTVHVAVHPHDPNLQARLEAFRSTGCEVTFLFRNEWKLYKENWELPDGRKIVSRMDDDDVIARDYCKEIQAIAPESGEWNLVFPVGYVWWRSTAFRLEHPGNQFVTLVTDQQTDPHQEGHWLYHKNWQTKIVSNAPSWIWVRHGDASTSTLKKYRKTKLKGIDSNRIPINLRAIDRSILPSGNASGTYQEHKNQTILRGVFRENAIHAGTAIPRGFE